MKIYTKTGDKGTTALIGGVRVSKHHIRIEAYGTVDELNSYIGLIRDQKIGEHLSNVLIKIQTQLFTIGAMLATPSEKEFLKSGKERLKIEKINPESIQLLENEIDNMNESLDPMTHFVLPGGHTSVSFCHIARCICRRAERIASMLNETEKVDEQILIYLNRLSDYLFVLARKLTYINKAEEIKWIPEKKK
ncbi:cob(I)yrinic acid a,c-diamide adenosyltransferase [Lutibacter sp. TH_r2]|uniref:cob(I)yrinic acid a,c-diamide adenosyltransferase n=1 Tax=Lutibacter sp. TH_r2 TaxID=3082083 RepID=UPI002953F2C3|nr:cob(I)yrinic acid a,c-diamide adenosyltransferase [Lutibacter sp. TH_r2]MDV7188406.1 cob(I)yrinic acid a,c-diamide adenosyltransferase [Lutibacter sp. TH_r2]